MMEKDGSYVVYGNTRSLIRTVVPMEQKIRIQQIVRVLLAILFCAAIVLTTLLMCVRFSGDVCLRLIWGENRKTVWLKVMRSLTLILLGEGVVTASVTAVFFSGKIQFFTLCYLAIVIAVSLLFCSFYEMICCRRNLIVFFQSEEG